MTDNLSTFALHGGSQAINNKCQNLGMTYPPSAVSSAPDHVPEKVARVYVQAEEAEKRNHLDTAAMGYRKTIDIGLKAFAPDVRGDFGPRINKLAEDGKLPPALKDWCHQVRLLGNEGTHELDEPAAEDVADLAGFTQSVLEYLFTMPKRVEDRKAAAAAAAAKAKR
ncbi:DUF4145 domain-containing protein [Methylobacterium sp. NEAU K]|uniref:DUF4145 domain-containing protein n=1 Tax=Methylobacterium sp. NEAU K TaxID=3064946 RepID=UPI00273549A5|nr:DUF4145 domain-containing protein [Methylobacterium sp. NEAU K]